MPQHFEPDNSSSDESGLFLLASGAGKALVDELVDALVRVREKALLPWRFRGWHVRELPYVLEENAVAVRCELSQGNVCSVLQLRLHPLFCSPTPTVCLTLEGRHGEMVLFSKPRDHFAPASPVGHLVACLDFLEPPSTTGFIERELDHGR